MRDMKNDFSRRDSAPNSTLCDRSICFTQTVLRRLPVELLGQESRRCHRLPAVEIR
jgi:hypothetical protein